MFFDFINDQVFKMKWLYSFVSYILGLFGLNSDEGIGSIIHFFIYYTVKITLLLITLIFIVSYIQSYFPPERSKRILGRFKGISANIISALLGTVTPFVPAAQFHFLWALQVLDFLLV